MMLTLRQAALPRKSVLKVALQARARLYTCLAESVPREQNAEAARWVM